jgi:hypothetical protein
MAHRDFGGPQSRVTMLGVLVVLEWGQVRQEPLVGSHQKPGPAQFAY